MRPAPVTTSTCDTCLQPWSLHEANALYRAWRDRDPDDESQGEPIWTVELDDCVAALLDRFRGPVGPAGPMGPMGLAGPPAGT